MARPRCTARPVTKAVFDPPSGLRLPPALRELLASEDPAVPAITTRVLAAKLAGANVTDPLVIEQCIAEGRLDHAALALDGAA